MHAGIPYPQDQALPLPLGPGTPLGPDPPRLGTPQDQNSKDQAPPQDQAPPNQAPPRPDPTCAVHAGRYGQQAGGMHPTGMQSSVYFI